MDAATCREAGPDDAAAIAALVNRAYRPEAGQPGWTHEGALVAGPRASAAMVQALLRPGSWVLVLAEGAAIVACVHVAQAEGGAAYIGMLAAEPARQVAGLGKRMLAEAERFAQARLDAREFRMTVLSARSELLAFYARRGYVATGVFEDFPRDAGCGTPRVADLRLERLVKPAR